jgi:para-nitrobenzyl esterase
VADPTVTIKAGQLRGMIDHGVPAFLGVPYAASPFGANRMRPPQPTPSWEGIRDAASYGPTCPQGDYPPAIAAYFPKVAIGGEECLNLNVWTPDPGAGGLPVMVWIHGGAFTNGSGSLPEYRGSAFARDGIVCVTINYRLGAEGFLMVEGGLPNVGLLDQLAALQWVQDNIVAFGGDPGQITVAGESAGGMSVSTLLAMKQSEGLFQRAIAQSGAASHCLTAEAAQTVGRVLAEACGVEPSRAALAELPIDRVTDAAAALISELAVAPDPAKWGEVALGALPFAPAIDGDIIPTPPLEALRQGQGRDVDLLTGWNRDEMRIFLLATGGIDVVDDATLTATAEGYGLGSDLLAAYRTSRTDASPGDVMAAVLGDWTFRIPAIRVAEARADATPGRTWMYRFDYWSDGGDGRVGASHGVEIPFAFDTLDVEGNHHLIGAHPPQEVADTTHRIWVDFIKGGNPGWAAYEPTRRTTGLIDRTLTAADDPSRQERELWEGRR